MGTPMPTEAFPAGEPTTQMPATGVDQGAGVPPTQPPGVGFGDPVDPYGEPEPEEEEAPWYKKPLPIALVFLVLLGLGALLALFLVGGDDDAAADNSSLLILEVADQNGEPLEADFAASVVGPVGNETAYSWVRPAGAVPGELAGASADSQGRVVYEWEIDTDTIAPDDWAATVSLLQPLPEGASPASGLVECVLERDGDPDTVVTMSVDVIDDGSGGGQAASFLFPNYQFSVDDTVTCDVVTELPLGADTSVPGTTVAPSTSVGDTTTTSPATTTTAPAATTTTTTTTTTTPPATTVPEETAWDVILGDPDLTALAALIQLAGLDDDLDDPNATLTVLAPTNQAVADAVSAPGAPDFGDPDVVEAVLLTHVNDTEAFSSAELLALNPPEFTVVNPGPHAIDAGATPPTVGGAELGPIDLNASNGVVHVIDQVLLPVTLP